MAEEAQKHPKVALGDTNNMKRLLDEGIVGAILSSTTLVEDLTYANIKLAIMVVSCAFACIAQFYPIPFPDSRLLLAVCVVVYFGLSGVLQYFTWFTDKDSIFYSRAEPGRPAVNVRAAFPKFTHELTLTLEVADVKTPSSKAAATGGDPGAAAPRRQWRQVAQWKLDVGQYFTTKGEFLEDRLSADVSAKLREPAALAVLTRSDKKRA